MYRSSVIRHVSSKITAVWLVKDVKRRQVVFNVYKIVRGRRHIYNGKHHFLGDIFNAVDVRIIITSYYKTRGHDS